MRQWQGKKIVIIGLGLIGGSLARALKTAGLDCELVAVGRNRPVLEQALADGTIAAFSGDAKSACATADLVLLAVPVLSVEAVLREIAPVLRPDTVLTDVASVKATVVAAAQAVFGRVPPTLVPGHPIAGSEQSGYAASHDGLFRGRRVILTPLPETAPEALERVAALWRLTGAEVLNMSVTHHDAVLAATSHLPHLLAFALVDTLSQRGEQEDIFRYAAGGFRDFTRIASSDPVMWRDIFLSNGPAVVKVLDDYLEHLGQLRQDLLDGDAQQLYETCRRARASREVFLSFSHKKAE